MAYCPMRAKAKSSFKIFSSRARRSSAFSALCFQSMLSVVVVSVVAATIFSECAGSFPVDNHAGETFRTLANMFRVALFGVCAPLL